MYRCTRRRRNQQASILQLVTFHLPGKSRKPVLSLATVVGRRSSEPTLALTGSTDGTVAIWDVTGRVTDRVTGSGGGEVLLLRVIQVHGMGVNAMSAERLQRDDVRGPDGEWLPAPYVCLVASGGDDNALCVHTLKVNQRRIFSADEDGSFAECELKKEEDEEESIKIMSSASMKTAAASAINGVWTDGALVIATGWDQRVSAWKVVRQDRFACQLAHVASTFVHVADCSALDVVLSEGGLDVVVAGQGLELQHYCGDIV
jgi:WD40 repeat protein